MDESLVGKKLGNFEITGMLGYGGMAKVYRAHQPSMQRDVAIKVMNHELSEDEEFIKRFEREAEIFAELQHPHILPVIDFGRSDEGSLYIVFRYVEGGNLDQRIRKAEALPLDVTNKILGQVASALTFAHDKGIVHRDVKTSNILLDARDNAYLTDFGIARMVAGQTRLTTTNNIMGTPAYMSPEQWRGEVIDARSDIYSLGVIVYEMLSGDLPYSADTPFTLMYKHVNEAPPSIDHRQDLPPMVETVVRRAMAKGPDERYQNAEDFAAAFSAALRGEIVNTPSVSSSPVIVVDVTTTPQPTSMIDTPSANVTQSTPAVTSDRWRIPLIIVAVVGLTLLSVAVGALIFGGDRDNPKSPTATVNVPVAAIVTAHSPVSIRLNPNLNAPVVGQMQPDEQRRVRGVSSDRLWFQLEAEGNKPGGWIDLIDVEFTGDLSQLAVVNAGQPSNPNDVGQPDILVEPSITDVLTTHGDFPELGLAFDYPERWSTELVDGHLELEPPRGPAMRGTLVEVYRGSRVELGEQLQVQLGTKPFGELMPLITRTISADGPPSDFQRIDLPITFRYLTIINSFEITQERHYVFLIQYQEDDLVLGVAQFAPGIVTERELQSLVMLPILTTLTIDGQPIVGTLESSQPLPTQPVAPPTSPPDVSRLPFDLFLGG
ncbi:MAG: protein kinase [Anaerolineales bacterium]|nr:protein kinase [Anaerolineales bacterium]